MRRERTIEGDTVDLLCLRVYGRTDGGAVEQVLGENPGLAAMGPVLPIATLVDMPDAAPPAPDTINLWD